MKRIVSVVAAAVLAAASLGRSLDQAPALLPAVQIFYYGWYEAPEIGERYDHWNQNQRIPPEDIASSFYPKLGPYSSLDPKVIEQHMKWIAATGIGVLVYAYQGPETHSAAALPLVMDAALRHGLRVAFLIDQNPAKTPEEMLAEVELLMIEFGEHPAFYRTIRPTRWDPTREPRPVFYLFDPFLSDTVAAEAWAPFVDGIRGSHFDAILLGQGFDLSAVERAHFDGLFTFDVLKTRPEMFLTFKKQADRARLIFVPTIGPGYDDRRAVADSAGNIPREGGLYYDTLWRAALEVQPEWVSVNSFNEWHEGTQIEPAIRFLTPFASYLNYNGSWDRFGEPAETAFLDRTTFWVAHMNALVSAKNR